MHADVVEVDARAHARWHAPPPVAQVDRLALPAMNVIEDDAALLIEAREERDRRAADWEWGAWLQMVGVHGIYGVAWDYMGVAWDYMG